MTHEEQIAVMRWTMESLQREVFAGEEPGQRHARSAIQHCLNNMPGGPCWDRPIEEYFKARPDQN